MEQKWFFSQWYNYKQTVVSLYTITFEKYKTVDIFEFAKETKWNVKGPNLLENKKIISEKLTPFFKT